MPIFFRPQAGTTLPPLGLAIPLNEGNNHWAAIYVDLEHCRAIYFNTMPDKIREARTRQYMLVFYSVFCQFFKGHGMNKFEFIVDEKCAKQGDESSCGIYVAAAVIDLLSMVRPRRESLTDEQIRAFRENGVKWLSEAPKTWDMFLRDGKLQPKKAVRWDPSVL